MLTLYLKDKEYNFPNEWGELTPEQFVYLTSLLQLLQTGRLKLDEVKVMYFLKVADLMPRRFRKMEKEELFAENVYRATEKINFFIKYVYSNKMAFDKLDLELKELVSKTDPELLEDTAEIRAIRKLKRSIEIDMVFPYNLIPKLPGTKFKGYQFELKEDFLHTSFTAAQYVDAYSVFEQWSKTNSNETLNLMFGILFQDKSYSEEVAHKNQEKIRKIPYDVKYAVMINFMAIHLFLAHRTKYAILFSGSGSDKAGKISLGFHDSIYSLAKTGYGEVEKMNLVKFLDLMLKELKDSVKTMHDSEMKLEDIASKAKLTVNQVNTLL